MVKRLIMALIAALVAIPALAQIPGGGEIAIGRTPVIGGVIGRCLYVDSANKVGNQACTTGVPTFSAGTTGFTPNSATSGAITLAGVLVGANGGTGVANTGKTITLGGNLTTSGAFASTFTMTNTTAVTFPTSGTLLATGSTIPLTVGGTTIASGTTTRILYDNAGVLGEYTISGTGTVVAMQTGASLITPAIGVATGTSLALNGATLGSYILAGIGSAALTGATTTSPDWEVWVTGDTFARASVGVNAADVARFSMGPGNAARDLFIERAGVANKRSGGPDAAGPVAQTDSVQNVVAGTSNTAGASRTYAASQSTGSAAGGSHIFQVSPAGGSGTSQNALATALTIDSTKLATFAGSIALGNGNATISQASSGGWVNSTVGTSSGFAHTYGGTASVGIGNNNSQDGLFNGPNNVVAWGSVQGPNGTMDTAFSRLGGGSIGAGTGAAGSVAGNMQMAYIAMGASSLTLTTGALGMSKMTASASAPGAGGAKEEWVCGTAAGSLKKIAYGGTSSTSVTIIDNVGSGATGC